MRVDIPEHNTFIDFPDDTPFDVMHNALQENFPSEVVKRDILGTVSTAYQDATGEEISPEGIPSIGFNQTIPPMAIPEPEIPEEILTLEAIVNQFKGSLSTMYNSRVIRYEEQGDSADISIAKAFSDVYQTIEAKIQIRNIIETFKRKQKEKQHAVDQKQFQKSQG